jgi:AhpC/TSA family
MVSSLYWTVFSRMRAQYRETRTDAMRARGQAATMEARPNGTSPGTAGEATMSTDRFTLIDNGSAHELQASIAGGAVRVPAEALATALGWELKPQGFCKGDLCYPLPPGSDAVTGEGVDLAGFARLIGRPLAVDAASGAAFLGESAAVRSEQLRTLQAPDFTLPDLNGTMHSLSDYKGKKVLLAAYGSW